jgi:peptidoglycan/LPS O-acetylase OafA/YrhL
VRGEQRSLQRTLRPDIQGLRALAVLLVFANHLWGWPRGGYIGVDVFFVISGFLITGLLIREREDRGRIDFREFYARRMRRIFPMATLVLIVTVAIAHLVLSPSAAESALVDALWAFIFLGNWHLIAVGTDYFHAADGMSAVQQYWSLSVEEQFYLVWPAILALVWWASRRRGLAGRWRFDGIRAVPTVALAIMTVASFGWALYRTGQDPTAAYFATTTRVWELGIGAILACAAGTLTAIPDRFRWWATRVGLGIIVAAALMLTAESAFPGPWALLPVLGTALVLAAGTTATPESAGRIGFPTSPVVDYVGKISYSLYLWHLPVIIFGLVLLPATPATYAVIIAMTFGLSALSFRFVEEPVRRSRWLSKRPKSGAAASGRRQSHLRHAATAATLLMLITTLVLITWHNVGARSSAAATPSAQIAELDVEKLSSAPTGDGSMGGFRVEFPDAQGIHEAHLAAAVGATEWPELQAGPNWDDWSVSVNSGDCTTVFSEARYCTFETPGATKTAVLFGDSQVAAWFPALRPSLEAQGFRIQVYYLVGCPLADVPIHAHQRSAPRNVECEQFRADVVDQVAKISPELTIVSSFWRQPELLYSGANGQAGEAEWLDGMVRTVGALAKRSADVVVLESPPGAESIKQCHTAVSSPTDCDRVVPALAAVVARINAEAVAAVNVANESKAMAAGGDAGETQIASTVRHQGVGHWFCAEGTCPALLSDLPIYTDGIHMSPAFAHYLAPLAGPVVLGLA